MAAKRKSTRVPKTEELVSCLREAGVGLHVLPTYLCLLDHCNSKTGRAWPSINRMATILGVCRRIVERHMRQLVDAGLVLRNDKQRERRGRFSTRRYVVVAVPFLGTPRCDMEVAPAGAPYIKEELRACLVRLKVRRFRTLSHTQKTYLIELSSLDVLRK